jgi:hypothetical protein
MEEEDERRRFWNLESEVSENKDKNEKERRGEGKMNVEKLLLL